MQNPNCSQDILNYHFYCTGLPTKDVTSETILRNLFSPFSCIQGSLEAKTGLFLLLNQLVNHQNTQLNAETKNQASNRHIFIVLGRLYSLII